MTSAAVVGIPDKDLAVERAAGEALGAGVTGGGEDPVLGAGELANLLLVLGVELADFVVGGRGEKRLAGGRELVGFAAERRFGGLLAFGDAPAVQLVVAAGRIDFLAPRDETARPAPADCGRCR